MHFNSTNSETFSGCGLITVSIPLGATEIRGFSFSGCRSLVHVSMTPTVTRIGNSAFCDCAFKRISIPQAVTEIGDRAFNGCASLMQIAIPNAATSHGRYAFSECRSLAKVLLSSSITEIRESTFNTGACRHSIASN